MMLCPWIKIIEIPDWQKKNMAFMVLSQGEKVPYIGQGVM